MAGLKKTLGIIGGGQLGKMIGIAAANLGIRACFYDPDKDAPAKQITNLFFNERFDNESKLIEFAKQCDNITYEFENIPIESIKIINKVRKVYPNLKSLRISQDRYLEKKFISNLGIKVTKFKKVNSLGDLESCSVQGFNQGILKTRRLGYDGKGQKRLKLNTLSRLKMSIEPDTYIFENLVEFKKEISVIVIREKNGKINTFEPSENLHKAGVLMQTKYPTSLSKNCINRAKKIARKITKALNIIGIVAVEMFIMENEEILVNEIAPRPHNSGHWTMDTCNISQFDALVRTILNIPIPKILYKNNCKMINLFGENFYSYKKYLRKENHKVYIYGKKDIKVGRKMGHVNVLEKKPNS